MRITDTIFSLAIVSLTSCAQIAMSDSKGNKFAFNSGDFGPNAALDVTDDAIRLSGKVNNSRGGGRFVEGVETVVGIGAAKSMADGIGNNLEAVIEN